MHFLYLVLTVSERHVRALRSTPFSSIPRFIAGMFFRSPQRLTEPQIVSVESFWRRKRSSFVFLGIIPHNLLRKTKDEQKKIERLTLSTKIGAQNR